MVSIRKIQLSIRVPLESPGGYTREGSSDADSPRGGGGIALAEGTRKSKSRFKEERPSTEGIRVQR